MANVLVTGASKGFGFLIVKTLLKDGHRVAAGMRGVGGKNGAAAAELKAAGAAPVELDVTDEASVNRAVASAGALDVVVNNAGVGVLGLQENFTPEDWKRVFDVNVFGVQRVNRAALPGMRERRAGLLIHVSSLLGRMVIPFYGPYNATKHALEALADNYRVELSGFGVESVLVEPGGYGTSFMDAMLRPSDASRDASYGPLAGAPEKAFAAFAKRLTGPDAPDPQRVADVVAGLVRAPRGKRPFRSTVDRTPMGEAVEACNRTAEEQQARVYAAFGIADVLTAKV
ncbi:MAG TPA: SDR family NAD(P)-dependent oxidoreductase [Planctomycetota bacterium]